jgi:hypothetical protein
VCQLQPGVEACVLGVSLGGHAFTFANSTILADSGRRWPREGCFPEGCQLTFLPWPYSALYGYEVSSCRPFEVCR